MRHVAVMLACLGAVSTAVAGASAVRPAVTPAAALAGERITIAARVDRTERRCGGEVVRPGGAAPAALPARRPSGGRVAWRWTVPVSAKSGRATARVTCRKAGSGSARFTIRALPPGEPARGKTVFLLHCGGCHTLADAETTGTSVDLDALSPGYARTVDRVVNGRALMPSFRGRLTPQEIADVATYVTSAAGR